MNSIKTACVVGGNGFIGFNLSNRLKKEGWNVTVVDRKEAEYGKNPADKIIIADARTWQIDGYYDRIYALAADMGGADFIFTGENDADILGNSLAINLNIAKQAEEHCDLLFYSSSACAYPDGVEGKEEDAYPAHPPFDYGWEKLISERIYQAYNRNYGLNVRIARFQNCFGPFGTFEGRRAKAPAAIARKILETTHEIEIWGDGKQVRPFIYIDDLLDGIEKLMRSDLKEPVNLGPNTGITIRELAERLILISGKDIKIKYINGPTGELHRRCNNDLAKEKLGWQPKRELGPALADTYDWIKENA